MFKLRLKEDSGGVESHFLSLRTTCGTEQVERQVIDQDRQVV